MNKSICCAVASVALVALMVEANNQYHNSQPDSYHQETYPSKYNPYSYGYDVSIVQCSSITSGCLILIDWHANVTIGYLSNIKLYKVEDAHGNKQWRQEKSVNPQEVHGSYGYKDRQGIYREVVYTADKNGFRAHVKTNEPGTSPKDPG